MTAATVVPPAAAQELSPIERSHQLDMVHSLIQRGEPAEALDLLASLAKRRGKRDSESPREMMLRGTARIMLGEVKAGAELLETALEADPALREGWLNLGGLEVAEGNYEAALEAFRRAHELAPDRPESHLNLGAVLVMLDRRVEARDHFDRFLRLEGGSADAQFLVAANYALAKLEHLAIEHLTKAIELDESKRMAARQDRRFLALDSMEYRILLLSDEYEPPADYHSFAGAFRKRWSQSDPSLLYAVLDALAEQGVPYHGEVESNPRWALLWADRSVRIKVHNQDNGTGVVRLSAPPSAFTPDEWQQMCQELLRRVHDRLGE
ncbi:MAG: tetratricopeptide repeat protein [Thermoanaerobaculia bacterium]|nr:tetratricopeptide repeat protein [Thermoanaerobaculia bacterium]